MYAYCAPYVKHDDDTMAEIGQYQILFTYLGALIVSGGLLPRSLNPLLGYLLCIVNIGVPALVLYLVVRKALRAGVSAQSSDGLNEREREVIPKGRCLVGVNFPCDTETKGDPQSDVEFELPDRQRISIYLISHLPHLTLFLITESDRFQVQSSTFNF
jgi:hypothetical protein